MMTAYFPDFDGIRQGTVCEFLFELEAELRSKEKNEKTISLIELSLPEILPRVKPRYVILISSIALLINLYVLLQIAQ